MYFFSEHKPRKGTETSAKPRRAGRHCEQFHNTNHERGRKHEADLDNLADSVVAFQNTNPERGRKRQPCDLLEADHLIISEHKPRKGTETPQRRQE